MRRFLLLSMLLLAGIATQAQVTLWIYGSQSPVVSDPAVGPDGSVYFATADNKLSAVSNSGVFRWKTDLGALALVPIAMQGNSLFVGTSSQQLRAYGSDGHMIWKVALEKNIRLNIAVSADGKLFFSDIAGNLYGVSAATGQVLWRFYLDTEVGPPYVGRNGTLYVVSGAWLNAINPDNGIIYWKKDVFNFSNVPLVESDEGEIVYIRRGGFVDVYDQRGNFLWEAYDDQGQVINAEMTQPVITGSTVIFAVTGGTDFFAMDLPSGATLWQYSKVNSDNPLKFSPAAVSTLAVDSWGTAYWCDSVGTITWLDTATGWVQGWEPSHGIGQNFILTPRNDAGYGVIRTGKNQQTLVAYSMPAGPSGPSGQYLGSGLHQSRFDDPPVVTILSPQDGEIISGRLNATVSASDDYGLTGLSLYLNKTRVAYSNGSALTFIAESASFQDGVYTLSAVATDNGGNQTNSSIQVAFVNPPPVYTVSVAPLVFSWLSNGVDNKYRVDISNSPTFSSIVLTSATDSQNFAKGTSWQPSAKKWRKVQDVALGSASSQTTFYWRVMGKTAGQVMVKSFTLTK
jgi:outer membrane protein assembly factor BamB